MYASFDAFRAEALACGPVHYPDSSLQPEKIEVAYEIYRNARKGTKLLDADGNPVDFGVTIVGRLALKVKRGERAARRNMSGCRRMRRSPASTRSCRRT